MSDIYSRVYPSLYRGIVESNTDPENLGRCKVRVPSIHGALTYSVDILPWARPIVLSPVRKGRGTVNIPDVGDIVWVMFEGSDRECPVYLGGTYARGELDISPNIIDFYIEGKDKISYNRDNREYSIKVGNNEIRVSPNNIELIGDIKIIGNITIEEGVQ